MKIKLKIENRDTLYLSEIPTWICYHGKHEFWYFAQGQLYSYSGYNYKFKSQADVEKLLEDMMAAEATGTVIYDVNAKIAELGIELLK